MQVVSKNGKTFLKISKSEWIKIGADFGIKDVFDFLSEPSSDQNRRRTPPAPPSGDYTTKNPLKSMPEEKPDLQKQEQPVLKQQRNVQIENGQAYEFIPKKDGTFAKRQINLIGVTSPEDLRRIKTAPKGYEENIRKEIIREKIRSVVNNFKNKQFLFIGFWEKTRSSTWRHMWGQIIERVSNNQDESHWYKLRILDRAIRQVREVLIDNIDYIRGSGASFVVDRVAANAHVNEKYPEGKANFVGSALEAARKALEQSKITGGDKI